MERCPPVRLRTRAQRGHLARIGAGTIGAAAGCPLLLLIWSRFLGGELRVPSLKRLVARILRVFVLDHESNMGCRPSFSQNSVPATDHACRAVQTVTRETSAGSPCPSSPGPRAA